MVKKQPAKEQKVNKDKPVHAYGTWIFKTTKSKIFVCSCGNKYLKTRDRQTKCLRCISMR